MTPRLVIPESDNIKIYCSKLSYWYTFLNISASRQNNLIGISNLYDTNQWTFTLPDGLYSLAEIETYLNQKLVENGLQDGLCTLRGNNSTQKVMFTIQNGYEFVCKAGFCYEILGCILDQNIRNTGVLATGSTIPITTGTFTQSAPNVAQFSSFANALLKCSLVTQSNMNGSSGDVILTSSPNVSPGSQMIEEPSNLVKIPAGNLSGTSIDSFSIRLTDQSGRLLDTNSENFYFTLVIEYEI
jgi:hypothetical protein